MLLEKRLKKDLQLLSHKLIFFFMGKLYIQIDGVAICSILVSDLINIFLGYQKTKLLNNTSLTNLNFI